MKKHYCIDEKIIAGGDIMDIIAPLWYGVSIYDGLEIYENDLKQFTEAQKYVHAMIWYSSEVFNGGHIQFYDNDTGIVWKNALEGFRKIGFDRAADILQRSAEVMGGSPDFDRKKRREKLDSLTDDEADILDGLDGMFYDLDDFDDVIYRYITENKEDFYFDGEIEE